MKNKKNKKKRKLNIKKLLLFFVIVTIVLFMIQKIFTVKITNIYVRGNNYYTDQEIIDLSGLKNYPNSLDNISFSIKKKLEKDTYIISAKVSKNIFFNRVYIYVKENIPLFYYYPKNRTVLYDGTEIDKYESTVTVINTIPSTIYANFLKEFSSINIEIIERISEIKYDPNEVDDERFFITMNDGNYVYITLSKFSMINKYIDIIKTFNNKKGVLYLDSGEYFDLFDE